MLSLLEQSTLAVLPTQALMRLAWLRTRSGLRVLPLENLVWISWPAGEVDVAQAVFAIPGSRLFTMRKGHWYQAGHVLPSFSVTRIEARNAEFVPLAQWLLPVPLRPVAPPRGLPSSVPLRLRGTNQPRPSAALICPLAPLFQWAGRVPSSRIDSLKGAISGAELLVVGPRLPEVPSTHKFWGNRILIPLGFQLDPELPENAIRQALGITPDALMIITEEGFDEVPLRMLQPLSRAGLKLLERGHSIGPG